MAPCGLCGSANLSSGFYPCCGSSVCDMCYTTTMVCSRSTLRPVKPCPSCGEIGPRQDEDGLRGAYKTLADKGHTEAGERLVVLLTTMVAKRPELMEEYEHYRKLFGPKGGRRNPASSAALSLESDLEFRQMIIKLTFGGATQSEIREATLDYVSKKMGKDKSAEGRAWMEKQRSEIERKPNEKPVNPFQRHASGKCAACDAEGARSKCARCPTVWYCSKDCQKKHWPEHKAECGKDPLVSKYDNGELFLDANSPFFNA